MPMLHGDTASGCQRHTDDGTPHLWWAN